MNGRRALNYFTQPDFARYDVRGGVLRSPGGTRIIGVGEDFLRGFVLAVEHETGSAAALILRRCGVFYGRRLAQRFESEISQYAGVSMRDRPMIEFDFLIRDLWAGCGMGNLTVDWSHGNAGFVPIKLAHSPMQDIGPKGHVADDMFCGILEGFIGHFAEGDLRAVQTGDLRMGDKEGTTFILARPDVMASLETYVGQRLPHSQIVERLAQES